MKRWILFTSLLFAVAGCDSPADRQAAAPSPVPAGDGHPIELTADNFQQQVLDSQKPVLVDFWATWCGPCMKMAPTIDELASEGQGRFVVGKIDVDKQEELAEKYNIEGMPTFLFFKDGKVQDSILGATSKAELLSRLEKLESK